MGTRSARPGWTAVLPTVVWLLAVGFAVGVLLAVG
jgi:hypothetical protein